MADDFTNPPLPVDHLPTLDDTAFVPVEARYRLARIGGLVAAGVVVVIATLVAAVLAPRPVVPLVVGGVVALVLAGALGITVVGLRRLAYQLREHDVSLRSGAITHRVDTIPFTRVQHVTIQRGPIDRLLGLANVEVSSAGPDLTVPGLDAADAARVKALITDRAGVDDEDDTGP